MTEKANTVDDHAVRDIQTERGITINNVISGGILMVMSWVGLSISDIKDDVSAINVRNGQIEVKLEAGLEDIDELQDDVDEHGTRITKLESKHGG